MVCHGLATFADALRAGSAEAKWSCANMIANAVAMHSVQAAPRQRLYTAPAAIAAKSPEQVYEERETLRELYEGLGQISEREQTYLLYRHGFADDIGHTLIGTAIHFHLSENRAKKLEDEAMDNLRLELPWWF